MKNIIHHFQNLNWKHILGEITLIVIGILIAMQINNWNENRKERIFERKILTEIKTALRSDLDDHIRKRIARAEIIEESTEVVMQLINEEIAYHDSIMVKFWRLNWVMIFEPKTAPFETLNSKGIEIVSNDALRLKLLELYDYVYPRFNFFYEGFNTWTSNRMQPFCLENFQIEETSRGKRYRPIDLEKLLQDPLFRNLVIEKNSSIEGLLFRMEELEEEVGAVLELLEAS